MQRQVYSQCGCVLGYFPAVQDNLPLNHICIPIKNSSRAQCFVESDLFTNVKCPELCETVDYEKAFIKISDVTGRTVFTREYRDVGNVFAENIVVNNISSGIYLLQISNGNKMSTRKLVIE